MRDAVSDGFAFRPDDLTRIASRGGTGQSGRTVFGVSQLTVSDWSTPWRSRSRRRWTDEVPEFVDDATAARAEPLHYGLKVAEVSIQQCRVQGRTNQSETVE